MRGVKTMTTLEIRLTEVDEREVFHVKAVDEDRLTHYGFGTFLENITPSEIGISVDALKRLLEQPERPGLQGLEFWPDHRIAWATPDPEIYVLPEDTNVPTKAKAWIKKASVLEKET